MDIDFFILKHINGSNSIFLDKFAVILTSGYVWIPLYVFLAILVIKNNKTVPQIFLAFGCGIIGVLLSGLLSDIIIKPLVMRPRPCFDPIYKDMVHIVSGYNVRGYSFFSSHAANTFSLAIFFTLLVRSKMLSITLFSWATLNAWTRLYLGVHWFTDVLVGTCWGMCIGALMYFFYKRIFNKISYKTSYISSHYTSTGYSFTDIDICMTIIVLTILIATISSFIMISNT